MFEWFFKGGPVMWLLLITSIVSIAIIFDRLRFFISEATKRRPAVIEKMYAHVAEGHFNFAIREGQVSEDYLVQILVHGLRHVETSFTNSVTNAANRVLRSFSQGLGALDMIITLGPLLGLLGTVTGMIHAFGLMGYKIGAPIAITGGIAQALITTACGLGVAIVALIPAFYFHSVIEKIRHEIEDVSTRFELVLEKLNLQTIHENLLTDLKV